MSDTRELVVVHTMTMRDEADCAVCCLAMLLGKTYADVLAACRRPVREGLSDYQLRGVTRRLGDA